MSEEQNKKTFRRLVEEGFSKGNLAALDELFAPSFQEHQNGFAPPTLEGVKRGIAGLRTLFPDLTLTIEEMTADKDMTWARLTARGTHRGSFNGLPPTGKTIRIDVIYICRIEKGKIVEHWGVANRLGMMQQIGASPRPAGNIN